MRDRPYRRWPVSPKVFAVNHYDIGSRGVEVLEQAGIDHDAAGVPIPGAIHFEGRRVGIGGATAQRAKMVGDLPGIPAVSTVTGRRRRQAELRRAEIGCEGTALGAERASTAHELSGDLAIDLKRRCAAMAAAFDGHDRLLLFSIGPF